MHEMFNVIDGKSDWVALAALLILTAVLLFVGWFVRDLPDCPNQDTIHSELTRILKSKVSTTSLIPVAEMKPEALAFLDGVLATSRHGNRYSSLQELQNALAANPSMICDVIVTDNVNVGYVIYWDLPEFIFIEQIEVIEQLRNTGIGTAALLQLIHLSYMPVVIEVLDNELTESNIRFLNTLGFSTINHIYCKPVDDGEDGTCVPALILVTEDLPNMKFETLKSIIHNHVYGTKS